MAEGHMKVTFGALAQAQGDISSTASFVTQQLADLKNFVGRLVANWEGSAQEAYYVQQNKLDAAAADLNQVLAQVGTAVGTANDSFQQAERLNAQRFSG